MSVLQYLMEIHASWQSSSINCRIGSSRVQHKGANYTSDDALLYLFCIKLPIIYIKNYIVEWTRKTYRSKWKIINNWKKLIPILSATCRTKEKIENRGSWTWKKERKIEINKNKNIVKIFEKNYQEKCMKSQIKRHSETAHLFPKITEEASVNHLKEGYFS